MTAPLTPEERVAAIERIGYVLVPNKTLCKRCAKGATDDAH